jgi:hypothetical protein
MEIKIECACGQPFEFEVEPVAGRMPCEINCPTCNQDATSLANDYITQTLSQGALRLTATPVAPAVPAPEAGLRINRLQPASAPVPAAALPSSSPVAPPSPPPSISQVASAFKSNMTLETGSTKSRIQGGGFLGGLLGALVAALLGMLGWYLLIKLTGYEIGFAAWGVGALTGFGARVLGATGTAKLGVCAGLFAFIAIIGGQFLVVRSFATAEFDKIALASYQQQLDRANVAVKLQTDDEIKAFVAKQDEIRVEEVSPDRLKEFRETDEPRYRELLDGKPSKAEFTGRLNHTMNSWSVQFEMLKGSLGLFTLLWLFLGVGSAYKLGAGTNG